MNAKEFQNWRSQFVTSNFEDKMGLRYAPFCFTEQGVAMLSSVLNSARAIRVNIQVVRIFIKLREIVLTNKDILLKLEQLEKKVIKHDDDDVLLIFATLKKLFTSSTQRRRIGFRRSDETD